MRRGTCKECGMVWSNKDEIVQQTRDEHQRVMGHALEVE